MSSSSTKPNDNLVDIEALFQEPNILLNPRVKHFGEVKSTSTVIQQRKHWKRNEPENLTKQELYHDFDDAKETYLTEGEAIREASRCLRCADAPCQKGCPTSVDVKAFITSIVNRNYYGAAQHILNNNPVGLSCGMLCTTSDLCAGCCNLSNTAGGPINISGLQEFAVQRFREMQIPQKVACDDDSIDASRAGGDPSIPSLTSYIPDSDPKVHKLIREARIAIVGAGPASICCATYLARLGYRHIHVFESTDSPGGISTWEIPQFRIPYAAVVWEVAQLQQLGVNVHYNRHMGRDYQLKDLLEGSKGGDGDGDGDGDGAIPEELRVPFDRVFLGVGKMAPHRNPVYEGLEQQHGYFTSKDFLRRVAETSKNLNVGSGNTSHGNTLPDMTGRVLIVGAGDVAFDCSRAAWRCGATRVTVCLRKNTNSIKATPEEVDIARRERVDLMPYSQPFKVHRSSDDGGRITAVEFHRTDFVEVDEGGVVKGKWNVDPDQTLLVKCDYIVAALGSVCDEKLGAALAPVLDLNRWGELEVADGTGVCTSVRGDAEQYKRRVFAGGDIVGSGMTVEAANDGKTAAWGIHRSVIDPDLSDESVAASSPLPPANEESELAEASFPAPPAPPRLPGFHTTVDDVDLSIMIGGVCFPNPYGLASAPPCTSIPMIQRAFAMGWGFAVTKTYTHDDDVVTNVSPRIMSSVQGRSSVQQSWQNGFMNIELISEKTASYWCRGIALLKKQFPRHVVIGSIMSSHSKEKWQKLARDSIAAGSDMLEMNLSCPHGMHEQGMGLALGVYPDKVREVCEWVTEVARETGTPVVAKLTPNVTAITDIAKAAFEGGCNGVTAINTVSGVVGLHNGSQVAPMRRGVGTHSGHQWSTPGGLSGNSIRPLAIKAVSSIAKQFLSRPGDDDDAATAAADADNAKATTAATGKRKGRSTRGKAAADTTPKHMVPKSQRFILATGGIDSADTTLQFLHCGASAVQICSAVMNQDLSIISDLLSGLRALVYMHCNQRLKTWSHQSPPVAAGAATLQEYLSPLPSAVGASDPQSAALGILQKPQPTRKFGPFEEERRRIQSEEAHSRTLPPPSVDAAVTVVSAGDIIGTVEDEATGPAVVVHARKRTKGTAAASSTSSSSRSSSSGIVTLNDIVARHEACDALKTHYDLPRDEQVVTIVNSDLCINCGKCFMACNDNGYQAITFDARTHLPLVDDDKCTGCGICESVCPVLNCITFKPRPLGEVLPPCRGNLE